MYRIDITWASRRLRCRTPCADPSRTWADKCSRKCRGSQGWENPWENPMGFFWTWQFSHDFMINCYGNLVILWICNILIWCVEAIKSMRYGLWNRNRFNWAIYTRTVFGSEHVFLRILPSGNWIVGNIKINQFREGGYLSMAIFKCNPFRTMSGSTQKNTSTEREM